MQDLPFDDLKVPLDPVSSSSMFLLRIYVFEVFFGTFGIGLETDGMRQSRVTLL